MFNIRMTKEGNIEWWRDGGWKPAPNAFYSFITVGTLVPVCEAGDFIYLKLERK